ADLAFAEQIGLGPNALLCNQAPDLLLGEWTFAAAAFPEMAENPGDIDGLAASVDRDGSIGRRLEALGMGDTGLADFLRRLRRHAPRFVDQMARTVLRTSPRIVGCTSSFQQHCAALALLRRIRELDPEVVTLLGGANCEGEMGGVIARSVPWVDVVVSGEADELVVPLCRHLLEHGRNLDPRELPFGALSGEPGSETTPRAKVGRMERVPIPDYDDYFLAVAASPLRPRLKPVLLAESSRGCWWGEQQHCTFCGLNGIGMGYRSKPAERTLQELDTLSGRYGVRRFEMVDNILDMAYLRDLLPKLKDRGAPYSLFYETKANLKREHVELLMASGVDAIQPGIENLHGEALRQVRKGCTPLHNLQLLKWSRETGMRLAWSILVGMPDESDDWWAEIAEWIPWIEHLEPPSGVSQIHFQRFSPYL
ncbi:MAG: RiPP maturation radical SAM C-methyltransferase, partial [Holophagales bacterium]|nr:RiPP maturation radical SAM C-methyltransferase [Holophagales bacterium]